MKSDYFIAKSFYSSPLKVKENPCQILAGRDLGIKIAFYHYDIDLMSITIP